MQSLLAVKTHLIFLRMSVGGFNIYSKSSETVFKEITVAQGLMIASLLTIIVIRKILLGLFQDIICLFLPT